MKSQAKGTRRWRLGGARKFRGCCLLGFAHLSLSFGASRLAMLETGFLLFLSLPLVSLPLQRVVCVLICAIVRWQTTHLPRHRAKDHPTCVSNDIQISRLEPRPEYSPQVYMEQWMPRVKGNTSNSKYQILTDILLHSRKPHKLLFYVLFYAA